MEPLVHSVLNARSHLVIWAAQSHGPGLALFGPNRGPQRARCRWNERQPSAIPNIGSVSPNQLVVVQLLRVQRPPPPWTVPMRTRCCWDCCRGSWSVSSLSCAARFIFFMEGTGMTEASKQRRLLFNGVSASPRARLAWSEMVVSRRQLFWPKKLPRGRCPRKRFSVHVFRA